MGFSGFQHSGFQRNAFQIMGGVVVQQPQGGGGKISKHKFQTEHNTYEVSKAAYLKKQRELQALKAKKAAQDRAAEEKEAQILRLEAKRAGNLSNTFFQKQLLKAMQEAEAIRALQAEINQQIMMMQREEEDIYILLLCLPFSA